MTGDLWRACCGVSYEYWNDIGVRDAIADSIEARSFGSASERERLAEIDERLFRLYDDPPARAERWWRFRLPRGVEE